MRRGVFARNIRLCALRMYESEITSSSKTESDKGKEQVTFALDVQVLKALPRSETKSA